MVELLAAAGANINARDKVRWLGRMCITLVRRPLMCMTHHFTNGKHLVYWRFTAVRQGCLASAYTAPSGVPTTHASYVCTSRPT